MKTILTKGLYLLWSCLFYIPVDAQNTASYPSSAPGDIADRQTETMHKALTLEPDQMQMVRDINLRFAKLMGGAEVHELAELSDTKLSELREALTSEQYEKWKEIKKTWLDLVKKNQSLPDIQVGTSFD